VGRSAVTSGRDDAQRSPEPFKAVSQSAPTGRPIAPINACAGHDAQLFSGPPPSRGDSDALGRRSRCGQHPSWDPAFGAGTLEGVLDRCLIEAFCAANGPTMREAGDRDIVALRSSTIWNRAGSSGQRTLPAPKNAGPLRGLLSNRSGSCWNGRGSNMRTVLGTKAICKSYGRWAHPCSLRLPCRMTGRGRDLRQKDAF